MLTAIYFIVILLGLLFKKSKCVRIIQYVSIYIIFALNSWNQDDVNYKNIYSGYYGSSHEPGFDLLCREFYKRGIPYETFRILFVSVAIILLLFALHKGFRESGNRPYSLLLLYPLLPLAELLRNLMAIAIVLCGASWYFSIEKEKLKHKIILILVILIGATFHYNVLVFLIMLLPNEMKSTKKTYYLVALLSAASLAVCNIPVFRRILGAVFASEKVLSWFDFTNRIGLGVILVFAFHLISFSIYDFTYRNYKAKTSRNLEITGNTDRMSSMIYSANIFSFALVGLYTYNMEFFGRLYMLILIFNCFHISLMIKKAKSTNIYLLGSLQTIYHVALFIFFCHPFSEDGIMNMILQNNYLFH